MSIAALRLEPADEASQDFADVVEIRGPSIVVENGYGRRTVERAASCLMDPQVGDRVLVVQSREEAYVLAVVQSERAGAHMTVDGVFEVHAQSFVVRSVKHVSLAGDAVGIAGSSLRMSAASADVLFDKLGYFGSEVISRVGTATLVLDVLESVVDRARQQFRRSYRMIEESEQVDAQRFEVRAREQLTLSARHAFVHAAELVKVMAEQIHMG
jgi:hypothetical protein